MKELIQSSVNLLFSIAEIAVIFIIRPIWKWLAHLYTGKCELERIVFNENLTNFVKNEFIGKKKCLMVILVLAF